MLNRNYINNHKDYYSLYKKYSSINDIAKPFNYKNSTSDIFYQKYCKYKKKYLSLKESKYLNQIAGAVKEESNKNILLSKEKGLIGTIEWANNNAEKYFDEKIEKGIWGLKKNVSTMKFKLENVEADIDFNLFHLRNSKENSKPLIVLPGYSSDSLGMTLTRTSKFKDVIFSKGFSDIYVFDFTGIGGRKKDKPEDPGFDIQALVKQYPSGINRMYEIISEHLARYISQNFNNFSILGRSAGGGLSMQMVFLHGLNPIGLNLAAPGYSYQDIHEYIINYSNKDLPLRICWAKEDNKIPEIQDENGSDGKKLKKSIENSLYTNIEYYSISIGSYDVKLTHRILPILFENIV